MRRHCISRDSSSNGHDGICSQWSVAVPAFSTSARLASQIVVPKMLPLQRAEVAEWQTRGIQNPVSFTGCVGSTPTFGTLGERYHRLAIMLRTPHFAGFL